MSTGRAVYSAHRARVLGVEAAGQQVAQNFWDIVGFEEVMRIGEGPELLVDSRRADNHTVEPFTARKVVVVKTTAESAVTRSIRVAESGAIRDYDISTVVLDEIDRLVKEKAALWGGLAELAAEN